MPGRHVTIDPVTRLEGHGKIDIFLDEQGEVGDCFFQVPELRGFEKFCEGRPVEEMPRITTRICGVCPEAHMMAAAKAADAVYGITLPATARLLRELQYQMFYVTDHTTHFYALAAPDFVMGPRSDPAQRNLIGIIRKLGLEIGGQVIQCRQWGHEAAEIFGGRPVRPINAIPGGMSKGLSADERHRLDEIVRFMVDFAQASLRLFRKVVLDSGEYRDLILSDPYTHATYSMGLVDEQNHVNFYDGRVRVVDPEGKELVQVRARRLREACRGAGGALDLPQVPVPAARWAGRASWTGRTPASTARPPGRGSTSPTGCRTPLAQEAYEEYFETLTGDRTRPQARPPHARHPLGAARGDAARRGARAGARPPPGDHPPRALPGPAHRDPARGGRDRRGAARHPDPPLRDRREGDPEEGQPDRGHDQQPRGHLHVHQEGRAGRPPRRDLPDEGLLNMIEMAFRAYDPCYGCATHALPGEMPLEVRIRDPRGVVLREVRR